MAKKVSKNQRTDRGRNIQRKRVAKMVVAEKKPNGQYRFVQKIVDLDNVQEELKTAKTAL